MKLYTTVAALFLCASSFSQAMLKNTLRNIQKPVRFYQKNINHLKTVHSDTFSKIAAGTIVAVPFFVPLVCETFRVKMITKK